MNEWMGATHQVHTKYVVSRKVAASASSMTFATILTTGLATSLPNASESTVETIPPTDGMCCEG